MKKLYEIWKVNGQEYKLKLKLSEIERLERQYAMGSLVNPLIQASQGVLPSTVYIVDVLHGAMQKFQHGYSRQIVADLFEDWLEEGGTTTDAISMLNGIFVASGFFKGEKTKKETIIEGKEEIK